MMVIIFCPAGNATGGTELLHQLGYKLNMLGFDACMYYYGRDEDHPATHPHFLKYNVPVRDVVSDDPDNIFVYPELMVSSLEDIKGQLPQSRHVLWWLSVDNAGMTPEMEETVSKDTQLIHFVQSYYAQGYVKDTLKVPDDRLFYLSDYLNTAFLNIDTKGPRDDVVLFNPRKGFERTVRLIESSDYRIKWQALAGLAPEDIPGVLRKAKVYIDFGNHPGKDRFPREAVMCGCRLITGVRGAAANDRDVPIPKELKVPDDLEDWKIVGMISSLLENYDRTGELYEDYREKIREEFHTFEADALKVFANLTGKNTENELADAGEMKAVITDAVTKEKYVKAFYYITLYRTRQYEADVEMLILEGYTRLGLGEEDVALYLMNDLLGRDDANYEAYLIKARALVSSGSPEAADALDLAVKCSIGTDDEGYIREAVAALKEAMNG